MNSNIDRCRLLLYLAVCVSFVSPYLFITPTPNLCPIGLRMRGGRPLLDYGIQVSVFTRNDASQWRTRSHALLLSPLAPRQRSEFHVIESHSADVRIQLDTESPRRAPRDVPPQTGSVRWIQVSVVWSIRADRHFIIIIFFNGKCLVHRSHELLFILVVEARTEFKYRQKPTAFV